MLTAHGLALALTRPGSHRHGPGDDVEVLLLHADRPEPSVLMAGADLDVTALGWPLPPRPVELRSYLREVMARHGRSVVRRPSVDVMSEVRTRLVGPWPDTHLEWTFRLERRPGVRLRRRVALFDDLGRVQEPEYAIVTLDEDLATWRIPPLDLARDGVLDC